MKRALITGITGQDGSYLTEFLLTKNYEVHGIIRRSSSFNTGRIDHIINDEKYKDRFFFYHGDVTDTSNLNRILEKTNPDEIYNLAAQSHVKVSFEIPDYTAQVDALGTLRFLDAIRETGLNKIKFYQASSSELYGKVQEMPQNEKTPFYPCSPYAVAKLYAYWIIVNYREAYNLFACNGILFNHESPRRGETFVTKKITRAAVRIKEGLQDKLVLGNLNAKRDWGHARDYVEAQWLMLQQDEPEDFVIATGEQHSVRNFIEIAAQALEMTISWQGSGLHEVGVWANPTNTRPQNKSESQQEVIRIDPRYFRPTEVSSLLGDASKARLKLGWKPVTTFHDMIKEMVESDLQDVKISQAQLAIPSHISVL